MNNGVLVVDKPAGMTSADVVARVKKALGADKVGHTGTLDPMATGVLPIVVGEATKIASFLLADDKEYDGELELGVETDTLDAEGTVTRQAESSGITETSLRDAMGDWIGDRPQVPPMYSALKHDGKRLYDLARRGAELELEARPIHVAAFELREFVPPRARFHVACSKGTYVRSLVRDVGRALGCGAHLTALRRTRAGRFDLSHAQPLDRIAPAAALVSAADALDHLPAIHLDPRGVAAVRHGQAIAVPLSTPEDTPLRLLTPEGALAAIAEVSGARLRFLRVFKG